jgi:hypothetical protein
MSPDVAGRIIDRMVSAMRQRDIRPFLDIAAPDADIFGSRPTDLRRYPMGSVRMFSVRRREVRWSDLTITRSRNVALLAFLIRTVNVDDEGKVTRRGPFYVRLALSKGRVPKLWGLYTAEEWQVVWADRGPPPPRLISGRS